MDRKKSRQPRTAPGNGGSILYCDLTQSWSEQGGGVRTYLLHKRQHILERPTLDYLKINTLHAERGNGESGDLFQAFLACKIFGDGCTDLWCGGSKVYNNLRILLL